jgi:outer membrane lipoprotein LolB
LIRPIVLTFLVLLLGGCTGLRPVTEDWDARRNILLQLDGWSLAGRVAVRTVDGEGGQASLNWQQASEHSELQLAGPLGSGRVELSIGPDSVHFRDASGERSLEYQGPDATEQFMTEQLGWYLPVGSARYWVMGVLDPAVPGERYFDQDGRLQSLTQRGWNIGIERFMSYGGQEMPAKLVMQNPRLRLKLAVGEWEFD